MKKRIAAAGFVIICIMSAQLVTAAEGIEGVWEFKSHLEPMSWSATMTITKNAEGKLEGTWSAEFGESTLSDITFEKDLLKFVQTSDFGGQQMKTTYEATLEGTKLTGKGNSQFGESIIAGTSQGQAKSGADAIVGTWQITITVPAREMVDKLTITKNADNSLSGNLVSQRGESTISNVKFNAGKLTFTRTSKMGQMEFTSTYDGTVEGDSIKGVFRSDFGDREANATRIGAAKPETPNKPK